MHCPFASTFAWPIDLCNSFETLILEALDHLVRCARSMQIESEVVYHCLDLLRSIFVRAKDAEVRGVLRLTNATHNVPSISNHELEVAVAVDRRRDTIVVLNEFFEGYFTIVVTH